jgi:hypothetical protein
MIILGYKTFKIYIMYPTKISKYIAVYCKNFICDVDDLNYVLWIYFILSVYYFYHPYIS